MNNKELINDLISVIYRLATNPTQECVLSVSKGEFSVLTVLTMEKECVNPSLLSERTKLSSGRIADILKSLENKKYIMRKQNENDHRKTEVYLLEDGRKIVEEKMKFMDNNISLLIDKIGEKDLTEFVRIANRIADASSAIGE